MAHYIEAIRDFGTLDHFNTELTEHVHIAMVKDPYRSTNQTGRIELQMLKKVQRDNLLRQKNPI